MNTDNAAYPVQCKRCSGTGRIECVKCKGTGRVVLPKERRGEQCLACRGAGVRDCPSCRGAGSIAPVDVSKTAGNAPRNSSTLVYICVCAIIAGGIIALAAVFYRKGTFVDDRSPAQPVKPSQAVGTGHEGSSSTKSSSGQRLEKVPESGLVTPQVEPEQTKTKPANDLDARYAELYSSYAGKFKAPPLGQPIAIKSVSGAEFKGVLADLDNASVDIRLPSGARVQFPRKELSPQSRVKLFKADFADALTKQEMEKEKQNR